MSRKLPGSAIVPGTITVTQITGGLNDTTNASYAQANTARTTANDAYGQANTARDQANTARTQANTAYGQANNAYSSANLAYDQANASYNVANTKLASAGGTLSGDLIITGNLTVSGNSTTLNTEILTVEDAEVVLLSNVASTPALNAGVIVNRGTSANTFLRWDEALDEWGWSDSGTTTYYFEDLRAGLATTNTTFGTVNTSLGTINTSYQAAYAQANTAGTNALNAYGAANNRVLKAGDTMTGQLNISAGGLLVTGNSNFDSGTLFVDSVNDRIGIGTTSPAQKLDVSGGIKLTDYVYLNDNYGLNWGGSTLITGVGGGVLKFYAGDASTIRMQVGSSVGIGTSNPGYKLTVDSGAIFAGRPISDTGTLSFGNTAAIFSSLGVDHTAARTNVLRLMRDGTSSVVYVGFVDFDISRWEASDVNSRTALHIKLGHGNLGLSETTDVMTLLSSGNVGIGTTTPGSKLHVEGNLYANGSVLARGLRSGSRGELFLNGAGSGDVAEIFFGYGNGYSENNIRWGISDRGNGDLKIYKGPAYSGFTEVISLTAAATNIIAITGNVGIGTTSPSTRLHLYNTSANCELRITADSSNDPIIRLTGENNGTGEGLLIYYDNDIGDTYFKNIYPTTNAFHFDTGSVNNALLIKTNGDVTVAGVLTESSSINIKENVYPITDALAAILKLVGVTYDRKDGSAKRRAGLIAEEVEQVLPNVVQKDENGNPLGIHYTNLIAYLVESIKELKQEINMLKSK